MKAMSLERVGEPLRLVELPDLSPGAGEVRIKVSVCGVCRTDLHVVDGELPPRLRPIVPGHEVVGYVDALGPSTTHLRVGQRVGVGWLARSCDECRYCASLQENLCDAPEFAGYTRNGGYASEMLADARFTYPLPEALGEDASVAPLLCAGLIGWRSLVAAGEGNWVGLYGFGAAAHIILQVAKWQGRNVSVFTRPGDRVGQSFARELGADWVGSSDERPERPLDSAIIFAPAGELAPTALRAVRKGGRVVCAGIHMSDIPSFPYSILWGERVLASVANLTRKDAADFLSVAPRIGLRIRVSEYPLEMANEALGELRSGQMQGAAVLRL